jgi:hypothetical protein
MQRQLQPGPQLHMRGAGVRRVHAPQYGLFGGLAPRTDNPAAIEHAPCPAHLRARLAALREDFYRASFDPARNDMLNLGARMRERAGRRALP